MKKYFSLFLALAILSMSGCIIRSQYYFLDLETDNIQSIQFYDLTAANGRSSKEALAAELFYTLAPEQHEEFLAELKQIEFSNTIILFPAAIDPSFEYGDYVVRFTFADGSYKLLSCRGYSETFSADHKQLFDDYYGCDDDEWTALIAAFAGSLPQPSHELPIA